jgi:hypothetical protein
VQTHAERVAAIESLLPLIEAELDPERDSGFALDGDGTEYLWAVVYDTLRRAYPQLRNLEHLLQRMMFEHAGWRAALYWTYVQPWDDWHRAKRQEYAAAGLTWLADEWEREWPYVPIPTYEIPGMSRRKTRAEQIDEMLSRGFSQRRICKDLGCSFRDVAAVSRARAGRCESMGCTP